MPERLTELLAVRIGVELDQRLERRAESIGYEKAELVRDLLDYAERNPPDWMLRLTEALRVARDTVSA